jgi:outer membrane protein TolC
MMQKHRKYFPAGFLLVICCSLWLIWGCATHEGPKAAITFDVPEKKIAGEKTAATMFSSEDAKKARAPSAPSSRPTAPARLTLLETIGGALKNNQKIQVASFNPLRAVQDLKGAQAVYAPSVFSSGNIGQVKRPIASLLDTGSILRDKLEEHRWFARGGTKALLPTGTTVSLYQELDRLNSNSTLVVPDPQNTSRLVMEVSQPLLKGVLDAPNRAAITIAKLGVEMSNDEFEQAAMDMVAEVARTYWQLVSERLSTIIAIKTLDMAAEVYRREKERLQRGLSTRLDADRSLAAVETRRAVLLRNQARVKIISDQLKLLLNYPEALPEIIPLDTPLTKPTTVEINESLAEAYKHRPELARAQKSVSVSGARKDLAQNNKLPKLDAVFRFTKNGLGIGPGRSVDTVYGEDNNNWLAGLEFEYPLGNQAARAEYTKRSLEYKQASTEVGRLKEQIASEVSQAMREVMLATKEIPTTLQAKTASERVVVSENARFELGQKSNEELLRAQDLLAGTELDYVRAITNYNISLVSLNRAKGTILKALGIEIKK